MNGSSLHGPKFGGRVGYGPSLLWAEFFMGRDVPESLKGTKNVPTYLTWYSSSRGSPLSHSKLRRDQSVSRIRGFWSCAGWATIPRGSYSSRIGLLSNEDSNMQTGNFSFFPLLSIHYISIFPIFPTFSFS